MYSFRLLAGSFLDRKTLESLFHLQATFLDVFRFLDFSVFGHRTWERRHKKGLSIGITPFDVFWLSS